MRHQPAWKVNLAICVTIVSLIGGYFYYQVQNASKQFRKNSREHSRVLAAAVELNIRNTLLSNKGLEIVITDFLQNSIRFIHYLNEIEPFTSAELSSFAQETGLEGIRITAGISDQAVAGPENWGAGMDCSEDGTLQKDSLAQMYTLATIIGVGTQGRQHCFVVGLSAKEIDAVQQAISVEELLVRLNQLPGIDSVRLVPALGSDEEQLARLVSRDGKTVSETRISLGSQDVIVAQHSGHFARRMKQMRTEFFIFIIFLIIFGILSSWWLYHAQRLRLQQATEYEQKIARQHEEAALGRAAATIAHEIRNPLNAIGMGLQRLQLETNDLDQEHHGLLVSMREAVERSNSIISRLQHYVRPLEPQTQLVELHSQLSELTNLYLPACKSQNIAVDLQPDQGYTLRGDKNLLGQLFENLIKNSVEAQQHGGYLNISYSCNEQRCIIEFISGGYVLSNEEGEKMFEPYFTSKTQGTGLGLAISKKIVEAHGGVIDALPNYEKEQLLIRVTLPR